MSPNLKERYCAIGTWKTVTIEHVERPSDWAAFKGCLERSLRKWTLCGHWMGKNNWERLQFRCSAQVGCARNIYASNIHINLYCAIVHPVICLCTAYLSEHRFVHSLSVIVELTDILYFSKECKEAYKHLLKKGLENFHKKICVGHTNVDGYGVCKGDSGGPLVCVDPLCHNVSGTIPPSVTRRSFPIHVNG